MVSRGLAAYLLLVNGIFSDPDGTSVTSRNECLSTAAEKVNLFAEKFAKFPERADDDSV
jgi:hypothetical protein